MTASRGREPRTLLDKIWSRNLVHAGDGSPDLLYVDLHLLHEVTSAQAFEGLEQAGRRVRRPDLCVATIDHNVPTTDRSLPVLDDIAALQMQRLRENVQRHGIRLYDVLDARQGIVHVIGPELGLTRPGMVIVCGDSHTSTHGAMGALAFGIGTSEVEHVLATQCIPRAKPETMEVRLEGSLRAGVGAKDVILSVIGRIGAGGAVGHVIEYRRRTRDRIHRTRGARDVHGVSVDVVQHVDRGRGPCGDGVSRRHDDQVPARARRCYRGCRSRSRRAGVGGAGDGRRSPFRSERRRGRLHP